MAEPFWLIRVSKKNPKVDLGSLYTDDENALFEEPGSDYMVVKHKDYPKNFTRGEVPTPAKTLIDLFTRKLSEAEQAQFLPVVTTLIVAEQQGLSHLLVPFLQQYPLPDAKYETIRDEVIQIIEANNG